MSVLPPLADIHNHLIPGVDDGARTLDEAIAALRAMREHGVRRLVATPHLNAGLTHRDDLCSRRLSEVDRAWESFRAAAAEHCPDVQLSRGHEIMLDVPTVRMEDPRLRLGGRACVLVEFPRLFVPAGSTHALHQLRAAGWLPIVAHPERYLNVNVQSGDLAVVEDWRRAGARMAINAGSLLGGFGAGAFVTAREMLRCGWADLIASDYHPRPGRPPLLRDCYTRLVAWGGEEQAHLLFSINPGRVIDGLETIPVPALPVGDGWWRRIRRIFSR